jgi:tripartite-type tricarboxylate transporter receptor subunit TctC
MMVKNLKGVRFIVSMMLAMLAGMAHSADAYPTQRAQFIVGFDAGGTTDILARALAKEMEKPFGQSITVLNQAGGGGTISAATVLRAKPDGHTFAIAGPTTLLIPPQTSSLPFSTPDTYTPIARVIDTPQVLVVPANSPYRTAAELIAAAKKQRLTIGVNQISSVANINLSLLRKASGADLATVPTGGDADSIRTLLGNQLAGAILAPQGVLPQVKADRLRIIGVFTKQRVAALPDVPTFIELGFPVAETSDLFIFGPKGMPDAVVNKLAALFEQAVKSPAYQKLTVEGATIATYVGPRALKAELTERYATYGKILAELGLLKK